MSPQKRRPQARKGRTAAAARQGGRRTDRTALIAAIVIIAVGGSLVFAFAKSASKKASTADAPAPAALVKKITGVPDSVITQVGLGTSALPSKLPGPTLLDSKTGKPRIVYLGAEYCPYCATERWAMVNAFSRFGTFKGLQTTESAGGLEAFPNTQTLSFYKSTYTSPYIVFEPVETETNTHKTLETPTSDQAQLQAKFDQPPYVGQNNVGAIPFIDFGNQFLISGASYDAGVLSGKTHDEIATAMSDPNSDIGKGAIGAANSITAAVCVLTNDKPANVCTNAAVQSIETQLKAEK